MTTQSRAALLQVRSTTTGAATKSIHAHLTTVIIEGTESLVRQDFIGFVQKNKLLCGPFLVVLILSLIGMTLEGSLAVTRLDLCQRCIPWKVHPLVVVIGRMNVTEGGGGGGGESRGIVGKNHQHPRTTQEEPCGSGKYHQDSSSNLLPTRCLTKEPVVVRFFCWLGPAGGGVNKTSLFLIRVNHIIMISSSSGIRGAAFFLSRSRRFFFLT